MPRLEVSGVIERDIDFLLLEEFVADQGFLPWFLKKLGFSPDWQLQTATHSATTATGETDIELRLASSREKVILLLENKIDAGFQPRQAERYRERADGYVAQGRCSRSATVLLAPRAYFSGEGERFGFDHMISYEDILDWFMQAEHLGSRRQAKIVLLDRAIDRGSSGWVMIPDAAVTGFWHKYWELARNLAPELRMKRPDAKPATSTFIYFHPAGLPKGIHLVHKFSFGIVDLQFAGMAAELKSLREKYGPLLEPAMRFDVAGKSAAVRLTVPPIDVRAPFTESEDAVKEGLEAAQRLSAWAGRVGI